MLWRRQNQSCGAGGGGQRSRARTRGPAGFGASLQVQPGARWQRSWASSRGCEVMPWAGQSDWLLSLRSGFGAEVVLRLSGRARRADAEGACVAPRRPPKISGTRQKVHHSSSACTYTFSVAPATPTATLQSPVIYFFARQLSILRKLKRPPRSSSSRSRHTARHDPPASPPTA